MSKSLFIIGAGPAIGQATAERFGREGWAIILGSRSPRTMDPLVSSLLGKGIDAHGLVVDATDPDAVRAAMRNASRMGNGLSAVLYNAAFVRQQDLFSMTDAEIQSDLAVNVTGGLHTIRAATEFFGAAGGTILVTGGGLAIAPHPDYASLGLGKAALRNLVQGIAPRLAQRGIRIAMATVATLVAPQSAEADGVAETFWQLATTGQGWEANYPPQKI